MSQFAGSQIPTTISMGGTLIGNVTEINFPEALMNVTKYTVAGSDGYKRAAGHGREFGNMTFMLPYSDAAYKSLWNQWRSTQTVGGAYAPQVPVEFIIDIGAVSSTFDGLITRLKAPPQGALDENAMIECEVTVDGGMDVTGLPT